MIDKQNSQNRQKKIMIIMILCFMIGLGLGYAWRMQHEKQLVAEIAQVRLNLAQTNAFYQSAFLPVKMQVRTDKTSLKRATKKEERDND